MILYKGCKHYSDRYPKNPNPKKAALSRTFLWVTFIGFALTLTVSPESHLNLLTPF